MARLLLLTTSDLEPGYRLAGARVRVVGDAAEAAAAVREAVDGGETGVIGVHEALWDAFDPALQRALQRQISPVVVSVPSGEHAQSAALRRARLAEALRRTVGVQFTFRGAP
jgi:vacuolar-type H+-ATPase subunit F/Vma7